MVVLVEKVRESPGQWKSSCEDDECLHSFLWQLFHWFFRFGGGEPKGLTFQLPRAMMLLGLKLSHDKYCSQTKYCYIFSGGQAYFAFLSRSVP